MKKAMDKYDEFSKGSHRRNYKWILEEMDKIIEIYERKRARDATAARAPKENKDRDPKKKPEKNPAAPAPAPAEKKKRSSDGNDSLPRSEQRCSEADPKPNLANLPAGMRACKWFMSAKGCRKENKCDMWHDKETKKQHANKKGKSAEAKAKAKAKAGAKGDGKDKKKGRSQSGGSGESGSQSSRNGRSGSDNAVSEGGSKIPWKDRPCKLFAAGDCKYGDICKFSHGTVPALAGAKAAAKPAAKPESKKKAKKAKKEKSSSSESSSRS